MLPERQVWVPLTFHLQESSTNYRASVHDSNSVQVKAQPICDDDTYW